MTEFIRKTMYVLGNIIIIALTPLLVIYIIVGLSFNITDAPPDPGMGILIGIAYSLFVYSFYRFMRKPAEGKWQSVIMIYLISLCLLYLILLLLAHLLWK